MAISTLHTSIRDFVRLSLSMPDGSVRIADTLCPVGSPPTLWCSVKLMEMTPLGHDVVMPTLTSGTSDAPFTPTGITSSYQHEVYGHRRVRFSFDFFRAGAMDACFNLISAFETPWGSDYLRQKNIGFVSATSPLNLSYLESPEMEERCRVEADFHALVRQAKFIPTFTTLPVQTKVQTPAGTFDDVTKNLTLQL